MPHWVWNFVIAVFVILLFYCVVVVFMFILFHLKGEVMPNPNAYDNRDDFMQACIPMRIDEGDTQERATAVCSSMWDNKEDQKKLFKGIIFKNE